MELVLILEIASVGLCVLAVIYIKKYKQAIHFSRKLGEALIITSDALEDQELTPDEAKKCLAKYQELCDAAKQLFRK